MLLVRFLPVLRRAQEQKTKARQNRERESAQASLPRGRGQRGLLHGHVDRFKRSSSVMYRSRARAAHSRLVAITCGAVA